MVTLDHIKPVYGFVDPAAGKTDLAMKRVRARSAIVIGGQDDLGRVFILHAWAERCSTEKLIEAMYRLTAQYDLKTLGVEANGLQALFSDAVIRDAKLAGKRLPVAPVYQPTRTEKDFRIRTTLQPLLANGKILIQPHMAELRLEIENFPMHPTKDLIDALASLCRLMPPKDPQLVRDGESEALARYLSNTGAPWEAVEAALMKGIA